MSLTNGYTSIDELWRTLRFLLKVAGLGSIVSVAIALFLLDGLSGLFSSNGLNIVLIPTLMCSFVGALFIFPVGWFKSVKWMILMSKEIRSGVHPVEYLFNPVNALFRPHLLTDKGQEARLHLIDALKWAGVGASLILVAVSLGNWFGGSDVI